METIQDESETSCLPGNQEVQKVELCHQIYPCSLLHLQSPHKHKFLNFAIGASSERRKPVKSVNV